MPYRYTINKTEQITISIQMLTTPIRSIVNAVWSMRPTSRLYMYFFISLYCDLVCVMKKHTKFIVSFCIYAYYVSLSYTLINFVHIRVTRYLLSSQFFNTIGSRTFKFNNSVHKLSPYTYNVNILNTHRKYDLISIFFPSMSTRLIYTCMHR